MLGVATLAAFATAANPSAAAGILPAVVLLISVLLSLWFNRGRAFLASVSLLLAYAAYAFTADPQAVSFAHNTVIAGIAIFVPLNFALISQLRERGILHFRSYRWLLLFVSEATVITWIASAGNSALSGVAWHGVLNHWLLHPAPIPVAGHLLFAAALVLVVGRIRENKAPVEIGLGGRATGLLHGLCLACHSGHLRRIRVRGGRDGTGIGATGIAPNGFSR